jgi:hypothetical protein
MTEEAQNAATATDDPSTGTVDVQALQRQVEESKVTIDNLTARVETVNNESAGRKHRIKDLEAKLEARAKEKADSTPDIESMRTEYKDMLKNKEEALKEAQSNIRKLTVDSKIVSVASKLNAVDPDDVKTLVLAKVAYDENGQPFIKKANGSPRLNDIGENMSIEEFTTSLLAAKPNLVNATGKTGANSAASAGSPGVYKDMHDFSKRVTQAEYNAAMKKHGDKLFSMKNFSV